MHALSVALHVEDEPLAINYLLHPPLIDFIFIHLADTYISCIVPITGDLPINYLPHRSCHVSSRSRYRCAEGADVVGIQRHAFSNILILRMVQRYQFVCLLGSMTEESKLFELRTHRPRAATGHVAAALSCTPLMHSKIQLVALNDTVLCACVGCRRGLASC
jgi:hypothetical protein